jgi:hypothetical protein
MPHQLFHEKRGKEQDRNDAVHVEEGRLYARKIAGRNEAVLDNEECADYDHEAEVSRAQGKDPVERKERAKTNEVEEARDTHCGPRAEPNGHRAEIFLTVELDVLAGVKDIETGDIGSQGEGKQGYPP